jgi:hypothetical protein
MLDTGGEGTDPATGKLDTVPILPDEKPGVLRRIGSSPLEASDGFAITRSGNVYVPLVGPTGNALEACSATGQELARIDAPGQSRSTARSCSSATRARSRITPRTGRSSISMRGDGAAALAETGPAAADDLRAGGEPAVHSARRVGDAALPRHERHRQPPRSGGRPHRAHRHRARTDRTSHARMPVRGGRCDVVQARLIVGGHSRAAVAIVVG